jgi:formate/nitrite transporter FocA (FNT family)
MRVLAGIVFSLGLVLVVVGGAGLLTGNNLGVLCNTLVCNLLSVTIGNLIGGVLLVGFVYWFVYLRPRGA